jgi:hypothetical protein
LVVPVAENESVALTADLADVAACRRLSGGR